MLRNGILLLLLFLFVRYQINAKSAQFFPLVRVYVCFYCTSNSNTRKLSKVDSLSQTFHSNCYKFYSLIQCKLLNLLQFNYNAHIKLIFDCIFHLNHFNSIRNHVVKQRNEYKRLLTRKKKKRKPKCKKKQADFKSMTEMLLPKRPKVLNLIKS